MSRCVVLHQSIPLMRRSFKISTRPKLKLTLRCFSTSRSSVMSTLVVSKGSSSLLSPSGVSAHSWLPSNTVMVGRQRGPSAQERPRQQRTSRVTWQSSAMFRTQPVRLSTRTSSDSLKVSRRQVPGSSLMSLIA